MFFILRMYHDLNMFLLVQIKVESAEITQADIDLTRSLYIPVANRAQVLFFCIADLQRIDTMYQYSLEWFIVIFNNSISSTEKTGKDSLIISSYCNKSFFLTRF